MSRKDSADPRAAESEGARKEMRSPAFLLTGWFGCKMIATCCLSINMFRGY